MKRKVLIKRRVLLLTSKVKCARSAEREWANMRIGTHAEDAATLSSRRNPVPELPQRRTRSKSSKKPAQRTVPGIEKPTKHASIKYNEAHRAKGASRSLSIRAFFYIATFLLIFMFPLLGWLYSHGIVSAIDLEADSTIVLSLLFPSITFSYMLYKGKSLSEVISDLNLNLHAFTLRALAVGVLLFLAILLLEFGLSAFQTVTHIPLPTNVQALLQGMPLYFIVFSVLVAPIDEEILFRGFLVPRIGIVWSALIFSLFHISYLSISEFVAAFIFGLIAGYAFKKTKSLYTTIIGHALVNLLTVLVLFL